MKSIRLCLVDDREEITADAVGVRLCDSEDCVGGDCRIDGVSARFQDTRAGLRGKRLRRRDDTIFRYHHRARLRARRSGPIHGRSLSSP